MNKLLLSLSVIACLSMSACSSSAPASETVTAEKPCGCTGKKGAKSNKQAVKTTTSTPAVK
jgi:hypothetical protein